MKHTGILAVLILLSVSAFSQKKVILQSNGNAQVFGGSTAFVDAYSASVDGDTIYLSGMYFSTPASFNKHIVIYGTGVNPDSTQATGISRIGTVNFNVGAAKSRIEGVRIEGNIVFQLNQKIDSIVIDRCHVTGYITIPGTNGNYCNGIILSRNRIENYVSAQNASNCILRNNIIHGSVGRIIRDFSQNSWLSNNVIIGSASASELIYNTSDSFFENNIIYNTWTSAASAIPASVTNNTFSNNCFRTNPTTDNTNTWINNYTDVLIENVLINYTNGNYQLVSPTIHVGTNGNQIGVYGGLFPMLLGAVPSNPHIQSTQIAPATNENGELQIQFKVEAQTK